MTYVEPKDEIRLKSDLLNESKDLVWLPICDLYKCRLAFPWGYSSGCGDDAETFADDLVWRFRKGDLSREGLELEYERYVARLIEAWHQGVQNERADYIGLAIPKVYREAIDRNKLKCPDGFDEIQTWIPRGEPSGIIAVRVPGMGKTRSVFCRLAALHQSKGMTFAAMTANRLKSVCISLSCVKASQSQQSNEWSHRRYLGHRLRPRVFDLDDIGSSAGLRDALVSTGVLFLDDLAHVRMTPYFSEFLHGVLEARMSEGKACAFTLQQWGEELLEKWAGTSPQCKDTIEAIVRRMGDFCHVVPFDF